MVVHGETVLDSTGLRHPPEESTCWGSGVVTTLGWLWRVRSVPGTWLGLGSEGWAERRSEFLRGPKGWRAPAKEAHSAQGHRGRRHGPEQVVCFTHTLCPTILQGWPHCHLSPTLPPRLTCAVSGGFSCSPPLLMAHVLRAGSCLSSFSPSPAPGVSDCEMSVELMAVIFRYL